MVGTKGPDSVEIAVAVGRPLTQRLELSNLETCLFPTKVCCTPQGGWVT